MKKLFLIPLLALFSCVMAWSATVEVSTFDGLRDAINGASNGDVIKLTADISYGTKGYTENLNITKSITLDGQGHTLTGASQRQNGNSNYATIWINVGGRDVVDVTFKDITIVNERTTGAYSNKAIETRGNIGTITLNNVSMTANSAAFQLGGTHANQPNITNVVMTDCNLTATTYYAYMSYNPANLTMTDCNIEAWAGLYYKGPDGSLGSNGSTAVLTRCNLDCQNYKSGTSNSFGAIVLEDDGIDVSLTNCQINCTAHDETGVAKQSAFLLSNWKSLLSVKNSYSMHLDPCVFTLQGASTEIVGGNLLANNWTGTIGECPVSFTVYGGTFDEDITGKFDVPTGFVVNVLPTVKNGEDITLYRVVKEAAKDGSGDPLYNLNSDAEGEGAGQNETTSFELSDGSDMTLDNEVTTAGYVQVKDDAINGATTVTIGQTTGGDDQTLIISGGLDVQGTSKVVVEAGATLQIGEGGLTTANPENIVIEANENGAASLLLNPEVIVNNTPNLTVKMTAKQIGKDAFGDYYWHRFAMPVAAGITSWDKEGSYTGATQTYPTYIYGWDYANNDWLNLPGGVADMVPLQGYTLTLASDYIDGGITDLQDVVYTFKGNLIGNTDQALNFQARGFNFFGNSYTGYMDVLTLIQGIENTNVEGTVYMWNTDEQSYEAVSLYKLQNARQRARLEDWQKEVAPMQTFILRLRGVDSADESVNYASAIWGNPRYGNVATPAPARRTLAASSEETYMEIVVTAANGKSDRVDFTAMAGNSDAFESGYDAVKYMNERRMNIFSTVAGEDYSSVVTDNIEGKTISLSTKDDIRYTLSFRNVEGEAYAIRDNVTGAVTNIAEGNTYEFTAQPNALNADRFSIVAVRPVTTGVENIEAAAKAQGIYTVLGQYIGAREMWNSLPAGIYVVDGVKLVK